MRPRFFPSLVNGRFGDPALYVDFLLERRAMLFDLGDIAALPTKKILRLSDIFVSHAHMDHFIGFDRLLRLLVGRGKGVRLFGPEGFADRVEAKLAGYTWNLVDRIEEDLVFQVMEVGAEGPMQAARFRLKNRFSREELPPVAVADGVILADASMQVRCAVLDHRTPCLGFSLQESAHVNVWRNRLAERGLATGWWLMRLKQAVLEGLPDDAEIEVAWVAEAEPRPASLPLGALRDSVVSVTPGQKIGYVTDAAYTPENRRAILDLARDADVLFIEASFAEEHADYATDRAHLTTTQAGTLAREAGAERVEAFHFSPRYWGEEGRMLGEVEAGFLGGMG